MGLCLSELEVYIGVGHEDLKDGYIFLMIQKTLNALTPLSSIKERALMLYSLSDVMKFSRQCGLYLSAIVAL